MKLRIRDNSLRFRLTRSEVEVLHRQGRCDATVNFPGGASMDYVVESSVTATNPRAQFANNSIELLLPASLVDDWADSEQVSISFEEVLAGVEVLTLLVEKDFACLAPREGEDETDMFPHPDGPKGAD